MPPRLPASISLARLAITSLAFMLVWVPEPVCQTTSGNSSSSLPAATSAAAAAMALPILGSSAPSFDVGLGRRLLQQAEGVDQRQRHALAADAEVLQRALGLGAPIASAGTAISPMESLSMRCLLGGHAESSLKNARQF